MRSIIIGADGGGTSTKLAAVDNIGNILGYAECGNINYNYIPMEQARRSLKDGVDRLLASLRLDSYDCLSIGHCALDGAATPEEQRAFCGGLFPVEKVILNSDVHMALYGAVPSGPGVMAVSGTGTMCAARGRDGETLVAGGWGYLLGLQGVREYFEGKFFKPWR